VKKDFYTVLLTSIDDKKTGKPIISFGPQKLDQLAILDSGIMGMIVLSNEEANQIN